MAEVRKITIEIVEGEGGGDDGENKKKKKTDEDKTRKRQEQTFKQIGKKAFNTAYQIISSGVENTLQREYTLTENYMSQTVYANAKNTISMVKDLGHSMVAAVKLGSLGGPVGIAASVGITAAAWTFSHVLSYQNRMSSYYQSLNASNYQSDFSQIRAGLIDGGRGTEN